MPECGLPFAGIHCGDISYPRIDSAHLDKREILDEEIRKSSVVFSRFIVEQVSQFVPKLRQGSCQITTAVTGVAARDFPFQVSVNGNSGSPLRYLAFSGAEVGTRRVSVRFEPGIKLGS